MLMVIENPRHARLDDRHRKPVVVALPPRCLTLGTGTAQRLPINGQVAVADIRQNQNRHRLSLPVVRCVV
jgi:hypothetical protein